MTKYFQHNSNIKCCKIFIAHNLIACILFYYLSIWLTFDWYFFKRLNEPKTIILRLIIYNI